MTRTVEKYAGYYKNALTDSGIPDPKKRTEAYKERLSGMYSSEAYRQHNIYPTMNVEMIYAVIAMCLELKEYGLSNDRIINFVNKAFSKRKKFFSALIKCVDMLPNSFRIARKWNIDDHEKRVKDGSITYDYFKVTDEKIEYRISGCMYVEIFRYYGIRPLCKIFCLTDESAYSGLQKHIVFIRHSDLSDGDSCYDEVIDKRTAKE